MFWQAKNAQKLAEDIEGGRKAAENDALVSVYTKVADSFIPAEPNTSKILARAAQRAKTISVHQDNYQRLNKLWLLSTALAAAFVLLLAVLPLSKLDLTPVKPASTKSSLPVVGSYARLQKLLAAKRTTAASTIFNSIAPDFGLAEQYFTPSQVVPKFIGALAAHGGQSNAFSETNVQVEGVDEADVVKTDGRFIYQINKQKVFLIEAFPAQKLKVVSVLKNANFFPDSLYVDKENLVVIGTSYKPGPKIKSSEWGSPGAYGQAVDPQVPGGVEPEIALPDQIFTKVIVYRITDKLAPQKQREVELEGRLIASRKIGSFLYFVTNKYIDPYILSAPNLSQLKKEQRSLILPGYRDTAVGQSYQVLPLSEVKYFKKDISRNYLLIGSLNLNEPAAKMEIASFLGGGENVYVSKDNLYVVSSLSKEHEGQTPIIASKIYKFNLSGQEVNYQAQQEVPGTILNQFSLDEHNGFFRLATTTFNQPVPVMENQGAPSNSNNVYVLNANLQVVGKLEGLAPGEKIYSARFLGDRAYLVTFKTMDPFFVVDLSRPEKPKVLGELKIPGYSDYLHPYDENHIIGFGKETKEVAYVPGGEPEAVVGGMKVAVFDVSNVAQPVEKFKTTIGGPGTDSELLRNHRALLFSKEKKLLAFPVAVMQEKPAEQQPLDFPHASQGEITMEFQGAYVYSLDLTDGLNLKGKITHLTSGGKEKPWGQEKFFINRLLYIDDTLYTLSPAQVKANRLTDLKEEKSLRINQ